MKKRKNIIDYKYKLPQTTLENLNEEVFLQGFVDKKLSRSKLILNTFLKVEKRNFLQRNLSSCNTSVKLQPYKTSTF